MPRTIGRRPLFFAAVMVASLLLYYPTPPAFRWVPLFTAVLAAFWTVALALEDLTTPSGPRDSSSRFAPTPQPESPFAPPPPPGAKS
jgi:hypothetical protein